MYEIYSRKQSQFFTARRYACAGCRPVFVCPSVCYTRMLYPNGQKYIFLDLVPRHS